ncbi:hypothetical protein EDD21DRAFT_105787 [Dissophora ornata]|nr:hypothetical protein BGZ58_000414 [Dissophora ornata]KAI8601523.1 hypothetical protein EDD21DRAFT_105787 [Dissophora ornata]
MDFFAQAYSERSETPHAKDSPLHSPRSPEGTCRGYGCEANAHLRRASIGLEADVPRHPSYAPPPPHGIVGHLFRHHDNTGRASPVVEKITETFHKGLDFGHFSFGRKHSPLQEHHEAATAATAATNAAQSNSASANLPVMSPVGSRTAMPTPRRRASVSNPCLLKHVNSDGSGAVRPPMMPQSLSSSQLNSDDSLKSPGDEKSHLVSMVHEPTICEGRELYP